MPSSIDSSKRLDWESVEACIVVSFAAFRLAQQTHAILQSQALGDFPTEKVEFRSTGKIIATWPLNTRLTSFGRANILRSSFFLQHLRP